MREPGCDDDLVPLGDILRDITDRLLLGLAQPPRAQPMPSSASTMTDSRVIVARVGRSVALLLSAAVVRNDKQAITDYEAQILWLRNEYKNWERS